MKKTILFLGALSMSLISFAQQHSSSEPLPKGLSIEEQGIMREYYSNYQFNNARGIESAPTGEIRTAAEWEEIQTLVITWTGQFNSIQSQIVEAAQEECLVLIACGDSNQVKSQLNTAGVTITNVDFLEIPFNSIWMRDYAGNTMYKNDVDSLFLVDWIYNRPRPYDDVMPEEHAAYHNIPIYTTTLAPTDLVNTGGNFMADGLGTGFASELILEENEPGNPYSVTAKTEAQIDAIKMDWMGLDRYIKMPILPYDGIHHIDMHMKLLDEETLLVSEYPSGVADGPQIEANLQYVLSNFNSSFGTPYKVVRITVPPSTSGLYPDNNGYYRTYSNSVFVNKTILMPSYRQEYDTVAIRTYEEALPGYTVVPIDVDNNGQNLISLSGAIHCITHSIGVDDPLWIVHQALDDTSDDVNPYTVSAEIKHRSGISSATMYYRTAGSGAYASVPMTNTGGATWVADIPAQTIGTTIQYYVEGNAVNGKTTVRPLVAPTGYWEFDVTAVSGIEDLTSFEFQAIYPNPANAITVVPVNSPIETEGVITLRDITGKVVHEIHNGVISAGEQNFFLFADQFASGSYLVTIELGEFVLTQKLMIK
ncbi:MAG: agmatine deiminase family protein [Crocinitomicaceae bacterium]